MLVHKSKLEEQNKINFYHSMDLNIFCGSNHNLFFNVLTFMKFEKFFVKQIDSNVVKQMHMHFKFQTCNGEMIYITY